ncbi:MAG: tetratricopeptide repeat protein, partial [Longimicrobiales bacterium]
MSERDIERWTREVAENPGAPSFVRLARAYRAQGRREAARTVVLQGLEHSPEHIGAHGLLALIHVEDGERQKAGDEWETMLRLDPGNFDASRGLGFLALERGDLDAARRHLEAAADVRPDDPAVTQALEVLVRRED